MENYKEKIQKLLALATSPNENEAMQALLMARKLMAAHKLTEADCRPVNPVIKRGYSGVVFSMRSSRWIMSLSSVIASRYCCKTYKQQQGKGACTYAVGFCGLEEDFQTCMAAFSYAVRYVEESNPYSRDAERRIGYAYGFVDGLRDKYDEQDREAASSETDRAAWGLVMVVPPEVQADYDSFTHKDTRKRQALTVNLAAKAQGYNAGRNFDPDRRGIAG